MLRYTLIAFFLFVSLIAEETAAKEFDIEAHITKIKSAEPSERRDLMNELKLELRAMNKESRATAIKALKQTFAKGEGMRKHQLKNRENQHQRLQGQGQHSPQHQQQRTGNGQGRGR